MRSMISHRQLRSGAAWLELILALAIVALLFQLLPGVARELVDALDFRYWTRSTWLLANLSIVLLLLFVRFGPDLVDSFRFRWSARKPNRESEKTVEQVGPREDVRVLMRRDGALRAKLRRKFVFYGLAVPAFVVVVGALFALSQNERDKAVRARNTLVFAGEGDQIHDKTDGVVGLLFRVRPDRDVRVTHLGMYDHQQNGLQIPHRVGIFQSPGSGSLKKVLLAEATIPFGHEAPMEEGFRWVTLPQPVTLQAGREYILAAETFGDIGDDWPAVFSKGLFAGREQQGWNTLVVGEGGAIEGKLLLTGKPWPACPDQVLATESRTPHGLANLIVAGD